MQWDERSGEEQAEGQQASWESSRLRDHPTKTRPTAAAKVAGRSRLEIIRNNGYGLTTAAHAARR
jgi:hypothetical protein